MVIWLVVMLLWAGTMSPYAYEADSLLFLVVSYGVGIAYVVRTLLFMFNYVMGFFFDDYYTNFQMFDYYKYSDGMGNRMAATDSTDEKLFLDYELEIATAVGLFVGVPLYAPRYQAAQKYMKKAADKARADAGAAKTKEPKD
jgi:hypothetical protein